MFLLTIVPLFLTEDEKRQILTKMESIEFFDYPEVFNPVTNPLGVGTPTVVVDPPEIYYFQVKYGTITKELTWNLQNISSNEQVSKLNELILLINTIIQSKDEYKILPYPRGGY
jgi:hypothetical protein